MNAVTVLFFMPVELIQAYANVIRHFDIGRFQVAENDEVVDLSINGLEVVFRSFSDESHEALSVTESPALSFRVVDPTTAAGEAVHILQEQGITAKVANGQPPHEKSVQIVTVDGGWLRLIFHHLS